MIKRKPYPKILGKEIKSPEGFYAGGALHYLGKDGKIKHDSKIRTKKELKNLIMSKTEFNKRYYDPEKALKNYLKKI